MPELTPGMSIPYPVEDDDVDVPRDMKAMAQAIDPVGGRTVPAGFTGMWLSAVAPTGWAILNGQQIDSAPNPGLTAMFGQAGGKITLPDMQNRFPMGPGAVAVGDTGGQNDTIIQPDQLPSHVHGISFNAGLSGGHNHGGAVGWGGGVDHLHGSPLGGKVYMFANGSPRWWPVGTAQPWTNGFKFADGTANPEADGSFTTGASDRSLDHTHAITAVGDHVHAINGATQGGPGTGRVVDNRPLFKAFNFIIKLG